MKTFTLDLAKEYGTKGGFVDCFVVGVPHDFDDGSWLRPAVVVVPGGAYAFVSHREGEPIALNFLSRGYHAFVLRYTIFEEGARYPDQFCQLASTIDYIRKNASELRVNPKEIFVVGFSAGGHLTGTLATQWQNVLGICQKNLDCQPTAVGMCYPVVNEEGHRESLSNIFGDAYANREKYPLIFDLSKGVSSLTPPTFLWHTTHDTCVDVRQSLIFANALASNGIHFELHVYPNGDHGMATCDREITPATDNTKNNGSWLDFCADFFRGYCVETF